MTLPLAVVYQLHLAVVYQLQGLAVLGAGLLVPVHAVVLHHARQEGQEVRILPGLAPHPAGEATLGVSGVTVRQTVEDGHTLGVQGAGRHLPEAVRHDAEDVLAGGARHQAEDREQH